MYNYNMYLNSDNYFISYHVEDNKIIKKYDKDTTIHSVPLNQHNIEVCERQLQQELYKVPKIIETEIRNLTIYACSLLPLAIGFGVTGHYVLATINTLFILRNLIYLRLNSFLLKDTRLSIYCLENVDKIKKITENKLHYHLKLQQESIEVLDSREGLTYNNIHQCIYDDLKVLKKTIHDRYGEKND